MKRLLLAGLVILTSLVACVEADKIADAVKDGSKELCETIGNGPVSAVSAVLKGKANPGKSAASDWIVGFQYSKSAGIMPANSTTVEAEDADADYNYSVAITGLDPATTYYFRSFVRQHGQDTYGETKEFTTKEVASMLETVDATDIEATKATVRAKVDLTDVICKSSAYGFLWGESEDAINTDLVCAEIVKDSISAVLTDLSTATQYCYKAYLKVDDQTFFGEVKTFTTLQWVTSITLSKTSLSLLVGEEETISVTSVLPDNANDKTYTWSSSDNAIATVDQNGKITAKAKGDAVIKATANDGSGVFASCTVRVKNPCPAGAVDLGLSVYWATCNLSESGFVSSPEEYGDYYAWGDTMTYYSSQDPLTWKDGKTGYDYVSYKWCMGAYNTFTKYCFRSYYGYNGFTDTKEVLDPEDDVAHMKLGGNWRMPTGQEWREVNDNCIWTWTTNYNGTGVAGSIVRSRVEGYKDKSIFFPAAGFRRDTDLCDAGSCGIYWASTVSQGSPDKAGSVWFSANSSMGTLYRTHGISVRPVSDPVSE